MASEKTVFITDSTHSIESKMDNVIKYWKGNFKLIKKGFTLDITENIIYFKYAYMHSWFGPYFALSCLFSDEFVTANKELLDDHEFCEVTFTDKTGTFKLKGEPSTKNIVFKQIPNAKSGNVTLHLWSCVYYPQIINILDKEPKVKNKEYDISKSSVKQILSDNGFSGTVYYTDSIDEKADSNMYKAQKSTVKNKSLKESILNILCNLKIKDFITSKQTDNANKNKKKKNKQVKKVDASVDAGHIYPFRLGTNLAGDKLFVSYYKDQLKKTNPSCSLIGSFTEGGLSSKCLEASVNVDGVKCYMSTPLAYSLNNDYSPYIYKCNKAFVEIDYSYQSTKIIKTYKLQDILTMTPFFEPTNYITKSEEEESKIFKLTTTYSDRQKCASTLYNMFYSNAKYVFRTEEGLLPTSFFNYNNGNLMWSLVNLYHIAIINKAEKNSGTEIIKMLSQLTGVIIEIQAYAGKSGLLTMVQYISMNRPALFKNI